MSSSQHSLFLQADGTVKSCGTNTYGQCGTGDGVTPKTAVTTIAGLTDVTQVVSASDYSFFLLKDGTVKAVGCGSNGKLGTGNTNSSVAVTLVNNLTDVIQISANNLSSLFLLKDGTVKSCGDNTVGQCGTGNTTSPKLTLSLIPNLTDVIQIVAGNGHSLFLLKDGTVKSCGKNDYGQCGTGDIISPKLATAITGLTNVKQISASDSHSLFLLKDGTVKSCGNNNLGQCGTGNNATPKLSVSTIPGLTDVVKIATGLRHSIFLLKNGTVKTCGNNLTGQCATGDLTTPKLTVSLAPSLTATDLQSSVLNFIELTPEEQSLRLKKLYLLLKYLNFSKEKQ